MVQDGVDAVEDVPLGDGWVVVVGAELFEGPVGDVLAGVAGNRLLVALKVSYAAGRASTISSKAITHWPAK